MFGDLFVDGKGLTPDAVNEKVVSQLAWNVSAPTNLAISGSLDKKSLIAGQKVLLSVNMTSTGRMTDTVSVIRFRGLDFVDIDSVQTSPIITGTDQIVFRLATAAQAAEINAAGLNKDCPGNPDCSVAEGDLIVFWTPQAQKDFVQINVVLSVQVAQKYSIFGAINTASRNIFSEGPTSDNTFSLSEAEGDFNVNHNLYLPLVAR